MAGLRMNRVSGALIGAVWMIAGGTTLAAPGIEETPLVTYSKDVKLTLAANNHIAAIVPKGSKQAAIVDGVEGPKVDEFFLPDGKKANGQSPFLFTKDGAHSIYMARAGAEYIICVDGKEYGRYTDPGGDKAFAMSGPLAYPLSVSPKGKHVYFALSSEAGKHRFLMDGKELPIPHGEVQFSDDDSKYVYPVWRDGKGGGKDISLIINGEEKPIRAQEVAMTTDGKVVAIEEVIDQAKGTQQFRIMENDKVVVDQLRSATRLTVGPNGAWAAAGYDPAFKPSACFTGQRLDVPGVREIKSFHFSPDGKTLAVLGQTQQGASVVQVGGKSAGEYASIAPPVLVTNEGKAAYVAAAQNGKRFVVIGDEESDPFNSSPHLALPPSGKFVVYHVEVKNQVSSDVFINNKKLLTTRFLGGAPIKFLGDGLGFYIQNGNVLVAAGKEWEVPSRGLVAVSQDGAYVAMAGIDKTGRGSELSVNGSKPQPIKGDAKDLKFTPDGKHTILVADPGSNQPHEILVDGKPALKVDQFGFYDPRGDQPNIVTHPDGSLTILVLKDGQIKRLTFKGG